MACNIHRDAECDVCWDKPQTPAQAEAQKQAALFDARLFGTGFLWRKSDGSVERIPADEIVIFSNGPKP